MIRVNIELSNRSCGLDFMNVKSYHIAEGHDDRKSSRMPNDWEHQ